MRAAKPSVGNALVATAAAVAWLLASATAGSTAPAGAVIDHGAPDCLQIPPEVTPTVPADTSTELPLEARVMVERADLATAKDYMKGAADALARIGIRLRTSYDIVKPADLDEASGSDEYWDFIKSFYGGKRPRGVDVVYYMTRYWSGGMADCIGGVRYPDRAFAFGSIDYSVEGTVPAPTVDEGVVAAHEIGHLLGAHHHYSNCAEPAAHVLQPGLGPCTVMSPLALTTSRTFSALETAYIRHYTETYAKG